MKTRLLKAVSVPFAFVIFIPATIYQTAKWVIDGKTSPAKMFENYMNWLDPD